MTTPTDYRALCAELLKEWDAANGDQDLLAVADVIDRARTLLSQREPKLAAASSTDRAAIVARLRQLARAVTLGPEAVARECDMRIPAEPLRDADFVLSTAADLLSQPEPEEVTDEELLSAFHSPGSGTTADGLRAVYALARSARSTPPHNATR